MLLDYTKVYPQWTKVEYILPSLSILAHISYILCRKLFISQSQVHHQANSDTNSQKAYSVGAILGQYVGRLAEWKRSGEGWSSMMVVTYDVLCKVSLSQIMICSSSEVPSTGLFSMLLIILPTKLLKVNWLQDSCVTRVHLRERKMISSTPGGNLLLPPSIGRFTFTFS